MNLKHNSPATKVTDTTNIFWVAAALCWQSAGCNYIGPTQTRPAFYWLQLHWGKYDILTEFRVCCSSVRMKQLQFLLSNNRGPEVFARKKTPTINCHQNDNYHDHHWDETLRTVEFACESIRFYIFTYREQFTLMCKSAWNWFRKKNPFGGLPYITIKELLDFAVHVFACKTLHTISLNNILDGLTKYLV